MFRRWINRAKKKIKSHQHPDMIKLKKTNKTHKTKLREINHIIKGKNALMREYEHLNDKISQGQTIKEIIKLEQEKAKLMEKLALKGELKAKIREHKQILKQIQKEKDNIYDARNHGGSKRDIIESQKKMAKLAKQSLAIKSEIYSLQHQFK